MKAWCLIGVQSPGSILCLAKGRRVMNAFFLTSISLVSINLLRDQPTDFNDLGKLVLLVVVVAIAVALAFTFVRLRLRDRKPGTASFITISTPKDKLE